MHVAGVEIRAFWLLLNQTSQIELVCYLKYWSLMFNIFLMISAKLDQMTQTHRGTGELPEPWRAWVCLFSQWAETQVNSNSKSTRICLCAGTHGHKLQVCTCVEAYVHVPSLICIFFRAVLWHGCVHFYVQVCEYAGREWKRVRNSVLEHDLQLWCGSLVFTAVNETNK